MNKRGYYGEMSYNPVESKFQNLSENYYEVLRLTPDSSQEEIEQAWKNFLRNEIHEDQIPNIKDERLRKLAQEKFDNAKVMYQVLSSPNARAIYNKALAEALSKDSSEDSPEKPTKVDFSA
ncbi:MAG TPA: DnaJ domain-containing protein [Patescibacteria group bacterium]|jgi:DnaJ-class molecular chaperone|nr:DnaJ domain-containing protein [Patescibacteria group bacterium]